MQLQLFLEEHYLVVDAPCVVQDDDLTRYGEIKKIGLDIARASLIIIVVQENYTNYSLRGSRYISQPRNCSQDISDL